MAERTISPMTAASETAASDRPDLDLSHAQWQSGSNGRGDVEIAFVEGYIAMRNAATPDIPAVIFTPGEWNAFVLGARDGQFDLT